jgi:hypothetical protein
MFRLIFTWLPSKVIKELFCELLVGFREDLPYLKPKLGRGMLVTQCECIR